MEEAALKIDLIDKIEHANLSQLRELYGLIINYFNSKVSLEEWDLLSEEEKKLIDTGLQEAEAGLGTPLEEANIMLRAKYGLNG